MSYRPGDEFGPYRVVSGIGRGAMGEVLLVEHMQLGAQYALKVLGRDLADSAEARDRFLREMTALAAVDVHPGIVRIHASGILPDGRPYFAMEYVEGQTLGKALRHDLASEVGIEIVIEIAEALGFLHERGIVHRDVKPDNVILAEEGQARLTDFGLAKVVGDASQRLTKTGDMLGTPAYMSPEQARGEREITAASDVYACGVLLYEILTGRLPHIGRTSIQVARKVANGKPYPKPSRLRAVDPRVEEVCLRALAFKAERRYANGAELAVALRSALEAPPPPPPKVRAVHVAGVIGLLLTGTLAVLLDRGPPPEPTPERLPAALVALEAHATAGNWGSILDARADHDPGWDSATRERWAALVDRARRELIGRAWKTREFEVGERAWDAGDPLSSPESAYLLAALGRAAEAPLGAAKTARERAWLAAWAGDSAVCRQALSELPAERSAALRWQLRGVWPALEAEAAVPAGDSPTLQFARGQRALALGRLGQAAASLGEGAGLPAELRGAHALARARVALAWGYPAPLLKLLRERLARSQEGVDALSSWSLAREVAPWLDAQAQSELLEFLPRALRDLERPWALDAGARLVHARAQTGAERQAAYVAAGAKPVLASRSPLLADLDACRRGLDGPVGIQLARVDAVAAAFEHGGGPPELLERAHRWLAQARRSRGSSPAFALVRLRLQRLQQAPVADDWEALEQASPGDPARLHEFALATERWSSWAIDDAGARTPLGFAAAAEAWAAVEGVSADEAQASEARLRRVEALANAAAGDADEASWTAIAELLAPQLQGLPVAEVVEARQALLAALSASDLDGLDAAHAKLADHRRGLTGRGLRALYLSAALGRTDSAEAYAALVGDLTALSILELRRAQRDGDDVLAVARRIADTVALPYASLVAAAAGKEVGGQPYPSPLDLARVVEEGPEEVAAVRALLRRAAPPQLGPLLMGIDDSGRGVQNRRIARALVQLWADYQGSMASERSLSVSAADTLEDALERDPVHPGLLHLHALALLRPSGRHVEDALVQRAVDYELALATAAQPWGLGPAVHALELCADGVEVRRRIDDLGSRGWLWTKAQPLAVREAPEAWPATVSGLEPWSASSLRRAFTGASGVDRMITGLGLYLALFETVSMRGLPEDQVRSVRDTIRRLLSVQADRSHGARQEGAFLSLFANGLPADDQRAQRIRALRLLCAPGNPRPVAQSTAGLPSAPSLGDVRLMPKLPTVWVQELGLRLGWDGSHHRARLWRSLHGDSGPLFGVAQLRDPWSSTRAILDTLHDGFDPHQDATIRQLGSLGSPPYALAMLRASAFDRLARPELDLLDRLLWHVRYDSEPHAGDFRHAITLCRLLERLDPATSRALQSDLLVDLAFHVKEGREANLAKGVQLGLDVDPEQVSDWCESKATSWWRRVRCAALAGDEAALELAIRRFAQTKDRWGLADTLSHEVWEQRLRKDPRLAELLPD